MIIRTALIIFVFGIFSEQALSSSEHSSEHCLSAAQQLTAVTNWADIKRIVDGDTLHLKDGRKIRLIGINTPELGHRGEASEPYGQQAYQVLRDFIGNTGKVGLSFDRERRDRYHRILAYVVLANGQSLEQYLLKQGLAVSIAISPNTLHLSCYRALEQQAREAQKGIWQLPEMRWYKAEKLSAKAQGYRFISGKILAYNETNKNIYLKLSSRLAIKIAKKDRHYFTHLKSLVGKKVKVRGWLNRYKGKQSLRIRTAQNLLILK